MITPRTLVLYVAAFVLAVLFSNPTFAAPAVTHYNHTSTIEGVSRSTGWYLTRPIACENWASLVTGLTATADNVSKYTGQWVMTTDVTPRCRLTTYRASTNTYSTQDFTAGSAVRCEPDGSAPDTTKPLDQRCPDPLPACPADGTDGPMLEFVAGYRTGPLASSAWAAGPAPVPNPVCSSGCQLNVWGKSALWVKDEPGANGYYQAGYNLSTMHKGVECTGDTNLAPVAAPTAPPPEPNRCPNGTVQVGIDSAGIPMCKGDAPPVSQDKNTQTTTQTNSDGSTTKTTTETTTNRDGSTTTNTTTTTTNADGSTTTTHSSSTGKTPDGKDGKSDQEDSEFCRANPNLAICKNSSVSGECDQVTCEGDAIQCAIVRQITARNCADKKLQEALEQSGLHEIGKAVLDGDNAFKAKSPLNPENGITFELPQQLDQEKFLGEGACFPDKHIPFKGMTITIPFSQVCPYLLPLRYALMVAAMLTALYIVSGVTRKGV